MGTASDLCPGGKSGERDGTQQAGEGAPKGKAALVQRSTGLRASARLVVIPLSFRNKLRCHHRPHAAAHTFLISSPMLFVARKIHAFHRHTSLVSLFVTRHMALPSILRRNSIDTAVPIRRTSQISIQGLQRPMKRGYRAQVRTVCWLQIHARKRSRPSP